MKKDRFRKIFGSGIVIISSIIFSIVIIYLIDLLIKFPKINITDKISLMSLGIFLFLTAALLAWSLISLPIRKRGEILVTKGIYRYIRHPFYTAVIYFFVLGVGLFLKSYLVLSLIVVFTFVAGKMVESEERFAVKLFGSRYRKYQKKTKKFIPRIY